MIQFAASAKFNKSATVLLIEQQQIEKGQWNFSNRDIGQQISALYKSGHFHADNGERFPMIHKGRTVLLVGLGDLKELSLTSLRIAVRKAALSSYLSKKREIEIVSHSQEEAVIKAIIEALLLGTYQWKKYKARGKTDRSVDEKTYNLIAPKNKSFEETIHICAGVNLARDLINDNADTVTSEYIEETIRKIVKGHKDISLEVLNKKELTAQGLNLHLAVNKGSPKEPKLIIVKYQGAGTKVRATALVGKGITFDTGGLNLKPTGAIETMRCDMSGAAAVIGTLKNTIDLNLKKNVIFACAVAENAVGSQSYKPGDVFRAYNGKTVEINNTDAEGRLVLADAIAYVVKNYKPERIIDIATLTGACVVALGQDYAGLMTNDEELSKQLVQASKRSDDRIWRLPIYPELKESVKSQYADIKNTGYPKGAAGALVGGEFLRQFTDNITWAHLDIAGTAYVDFPGRMYFGFGATGSGVRLLTDFLINN